MSMLSVDGTAVTSPCLQCDGCAGVSDEQMLKHWLLWTQAGCYPVWSQGIAFLLLCNSVDHCYYLLLYIELHKSTVSNVQSRCMSFYCWCTCSKHVYHIKRWYRLLYPMLVRCYACSCMHLNTAYYATTYTCRSQEHRVWCPIQTCSSWVLQSLFVACVQLSAHRCFCVSTKRSIDVW